MLPKAPSFVVARIAFNTDAGRRRRTISTSSSLAGLLAAHPSHWINTGAPSQLAPWTALTSANGSSATVSRSIGRITLEACTIRSNERPSMPGAACGRAATSSRGYIGPASERVAARPDVRTTRTRILKALRTTGSLSSSRLPSRPLNCLYKQRRPSCCAQADASSDLRIAEQELHGAQIASSAVDQSGFGPPRMFLGFRVGEWRSEKVTRQCRLGRQARRLPDWVMIKNRKHPAMKLFNHRGLVRLALSNVRFEHRFEDYDR